MAGDQTGNLLRRKSRQRQIDAPTGSFYLAGASYGAGPSPLSCWAQLSLLESVEFGADVAAGAGLLSVDGVLSVLDSDGDGADPLDA